MDEMLHAVSKLKSGKAGRGSRVLPEMPKASCYNADFRHLLLDLLHSVWQERQAPQHWPDAVLVSIPKKGDLMKCDSCIICKLAFHQARLTCLPQISPEKHIALQCREWVEAEVLHGTSPPERMC